MIPKQKFIQSFHVAFNGIVAGIKHHRNFKVMIIVSIFTIIAGVFFQIKLQEWALITICISVTLGSELFNTAIEEFLDHIHPEIHPKIGLAKDISAGAVLVISIGSTLVGAIVFIPYVMALLQP